MRVLAVTHGPLVQPELFGDVLTEEGHELLVWDIRTQGQPPLEGYDAVLVFGGKQNVGEELEHPWLHEEYDALRRWVADGTPLFGVCLGAQTLARATGGEVRRVTPAPLAGFYETTLSPEGRDDPVLGVLPERFDAMNANHYEFTLPEDAVELARGPVAQAFRVGERAWGVQFHPEVRQEQALAWFSAEGRDLPRPLDEVEAELDEKLPAWQEHGRALCRAFLRAAGHGPAVVATEDAQEFIRARGGQVFVWADDAGMKHVRLERPGHEIDFQPLHFGGLTLNVDSTITPPAKWQIVLRRFPRRRVDVLYNGEKAGIPGMSSVPAGL